MTISGFWAIFLVGCLGGLIGETIKWYRMREQEKLPTYIRRPSTGLSHSS
jgi:hypothetical protein